MSERVSIVAVVNVLEGLDERQHVAVTAPVGKPLAILAPAGSGKTRVLTRRIAWLSNESQINPKNTLAVTFTRKAANELGSRLAALDADSVTAGTFHALCLAQLRGRQAGRGQELPTLLERKARILGALVGGRGAEQTTRINEAAGEIEWAKARTIRPDTYEAEVHAADRQVPRPAAEVASIFARYEAEKKKRGLIDFDDLLSWCADALEQDPDFATSIRFRYRHFFVDEFQDISLAQLRVLRGWLGPRQDICVVGDDAQSIYSFAGAEASVLVNFARHFPGAVTIRLGTNYRSTPQIVAVANAVLKADRRPGRALPLTTRESGSAPTVDAYADEIAEARAVAKEVRRVHDHGTPWREIAVLYRTNAQSAAFEEAFRKLNVPYRLPGVGTFLSRPEVKIALDELKKVERATPNRPFSDHLTDLAYHGTVPLSEDETSDEAVSERSAYADALIRFGHEYLDAEGTTGSLVGFVAWLGATTRGESDPSDNARDAVDFVSFHRAKGLEWSHVFVTGVEQGLVPISFARTEEAQSEELRLLHVALSRAIDALHVSWAQTRTIAGQPRKRKAGKWIEIIEEVASGFGQPPAADARTQLGKLRKSLNQNGSELDLVDRALFAELKQWRIDTARAVEIPAFVVFSDKTLREIATRRPTTRVALLEINGVGDTKLDRYGEAILQLIREHKAS